MNDELQIPAVIDIEAMLQPISEESPAGESLRYAGIYDEITEARRADDVIADQGAWATDLKTADYRRVIELGVPALTSQTKDMQIAAWLSEALTRQHGFAGLRDSLKLMTGLQDKFWDAVHPEIDEGDMEGRANAIAWMDAQAAFSMKKAPITTSGSSFFDYEDSKVFDFPEDFSTFSYEEQAKFTELKEQAEKGNRTTADKWKQAIAATRRAFCEQTNFTVGECVEALKELNAVIEAKFERNQMPGLGELSRGLDGVQTQVKKLLEEKKLEEPDPSDFEEEAGEIGADGTPARGPGGPIQNRADALKKLNEVADYFQRTEPHSPVAYLAQRAVKWGSMPLEAWLREVVKDQTTLEQIRETLGFNTGTENGS